MFTLILSICLAMPASPNIQVQLVNPKQYDLFVIFFLVHDIFDLSLDEACRKASLRNHPVDAKKKLY